VPSSRGSVYTCRRCGSRPRDHATSPAASGFPFAGIADVERQVGCRGEPDRPPSTWRESADAADGDRSIVSRPRTTKPETGHKIYPYLLRGKEITLPNKVWGHGHYVLFKHFFFFFFFFPPRDGAWLGYVAVVARTGRAAAGYVVARVDHDGKRPFLRPQGRCMEALVKHGKTGNIHYGQGSQFTGRTSPAG